MGKGAKKVRSFQNQMPEKSKEPVTTRSFEWFTSSWLSKLVLVPVSIAIILTIAIASVYIKPPLSLSTADIVKTYIYIDEQVQFLSELAQNSEESDFAIGDIELGTTIESFLL